MCSIPELGNKTEINNCVLLEFSISPCTQTARRKKPPDLKAEGTAVRLEREGGVVEWNKEPGKTGVGEREKLWLETMGRNGTIWRRRLGESQWGPTEWMEGLSTRRLGLGAGEDAETRSQWNQRTRNQLAGGKEHKFNKEIWETVDRS